MIVKICSGRNSAPIRCVSRRGRFPSRSGAKDGGTMPPLRPLRRTESRTAGSVFGRFWAADSVPLRIVSACSAAPASEPAAIPVRSSVIPVRCGPSPMRPVAFPLRVFPCCSAAGETTAVPAAPVALPAAPLAPAVVSAVRSVPSAGTAATGNRSNVPASIAVHKPPFRFFISADFRFSNAKDTNFSADSSVPAPKHPALVPAYSESGMCPDRLFSYICPEKR